MTAAAPTPAAPPSLALRLVRPVARGWLRLGRWRIVGDLPDLPKYVIVAAPHTTNWDLPNTLAAGLHYGRRVHWMGKDSLFRWPYAGLMRGLGGVPVDRSKSNDAVAQMVRWFAAHQRAVLVIAPAGTRSATAAWKSGFYHIAVGAGVPIVLGFIDYRRRAVGIAEVFHPTGDYTADLAAIAAVYAPIVDGRAAVAA
jgi:1-acyl-sn-glycerol-3-phosphate acyltransferase